MTPPTTNLRIGRSFPRTARPNLPAAIALTLLFQAACGGGAASSRGSTGKVTGAVVNETTSTPDQGAGGSGSGGNYATEINVGGSTNVSVGNTDVSVGITTGVNVGGVLAAAVGALALTAAAKDARA